jgi:Asp-tRNA(Asn)/Glu-tRNA(Gln) amidotransferase A subunit family amidase
MGSDTCGSIRIPAANNNLFGLRVTQGLSSRDGIIPLSHTQDVGGPLARSMIDLVTVLDATVGGDPADPQTVATESHVPTSFRAHLKDNSLEGARLGLLVDYLQAAAPFGEVSQVVRDALLKMAANGAEIPEIQIEGLEELRKTTSVIDMEFKSDLNGYLELSGAPVKSLAEILDSGRYHERLEEEDLARLLLETMTTHDLDALVYPTLRTKPELVGENQSGSLCHFSAHSGMPAISLPAGFTPDGIPVGVELLARPFQEGRLIELGFAWEQAAKPRRPPPLTPSLLPAGG